jgi:hypothetical protein
MTIPLDKNKISVYFAYTCLFFLTIMTIFSFIVCVVVIIASEMIAKKVKAEAIVLSGVIQNWYADIQSFVIWKLNIDALLQKAEGLIEHQRLSMIIQNEAGNGNRTVSFDKAYKDMKGNSLSPLLIKEGTSVHFTFDVISNNDELHLIDAHNSHHAYQTLNG